MINTHSEKLIVKFITNQATLNELDELSVWIQDPYNEDLFKEYVKINYAVEYVLNSFDSETVKKQLFNLIENQKNKKEVKAPKYIKFVRYAVAASVIGIIASTFFLREQWVSSSKKEVPIVMNNVKPGTDKAVLTLEDGSKVFLGKGVTFENKLANSNGVGIVYTAVKRFSNNLEYNYITVPRGGQYYIKLSDGTQVWLNSESQLKYPIRFVEGKTREVVLEYGEAYFDVSPSSENQGSHFKVLNSKQVVEVLGTEFNIKAYKEESNVYTTLVEGKIVISSGGIIKTMLPGQQSNCNRSAHSLDLNEVDVYNEVSWKKGVFSFERKSLKEIMTVLSRWYDFEVLFTKPAIQQKKFNGVLGRDQKIEDILNTIKEFGNIKEYEIKDKTIILK